MSFSGCLDDLSQLIRDWKEVNTKEDAKILDPKVPLSIERTLLRWLRSGVILSSLSIFLLHLGSKASKMNGSLVGCAALIMVTVPVFKFLRRSLDVSKAKAVQPMTDRGLVQAVGFILAGTLGLRSVPTMEAIAEESLRRIWQFGANDLIKLLCGFGSLGLRHRPFLEAVASAIDWSLQQLPLRGLVQAAWFLAVLASPEHKVMTSIANQMLMQLEHLSLAELAGVAWSFASLRLRHGRLMQSIASQAAAKISEFDEEDLARLAWSFAALDLAPREFTRLLVAEAAKRDASQGPTTARGQWHGSQRRRQSRGHRHNSEELDERTREQSAGSPVERRAQRRRPSRRRREKAEKVEVSREVAEEVLETPEPESTTAATASPVQEEQASEMSQEQASMQEHEWHELQSGEDKEPEYDALLEMLREQIRAGVQPRQEAAAVDIDGAGSELDQTDKARILELFEVQRVADQVASRKRSQSSWAKKKEKAERKLGREYIRNEISTAFNAQHDPSVRYYNSVAIRVKKGEKSVDTKTIEAVAQGKVENEGRTKEDRIMARRIA